MFTRHHRGSPQHRLRLGGARVPRRGAGRPALAIARALRVAGCVTASVVVMAGTRPAVGQTSGAPGDTTARPAMLGIPAAGSYTYTLVPDSSADIKAAINVTVSPMSFITRGIARSRLTKVNPLPHRVRVRLAADTVSVAFDDGDPVVTPVDGHAVPWVNALAKETDQAHVVIASDTLRQTLVASDGVRENALIFDDGGRLRLLVTVTSHRLPKPLVYELLFRRDPAS